MSDENSEANKYLQLAYDNWGKAQKDFSQAYVSTGDGDARHKADDAEQERKSIWHKYGPAAPVLFTEFGDGGLP